MISKSQIKYIQSLDQKKYRDKEAVFLAEGPKLVKEIIMSKNAELKYLFGLKEWIENNPGLISQIEFNEVEEAELERISHLKTPNQVLAVFKKFESNEPKLKSKITLMLDGIQDPGNLGTIVRIVDWFGISQIICSHECADLYNHKVVQATMGSLCRVSVFYTDLPGWLKLQQGIRVYGTFLDGKDVTRMNPLKEGLIIIGNESRGIQEDLMEFVNEKITIPKKGQAESLNAAVAAGIILSHLT